MRKQLLSVFLPLLALALMAAAAETQSADLGATKRAALQRLDILRGDDGISIEITARGQVTPKLSTLASPARVIVDLPDTVVATDQRHITVGSDGIKGVRVGMDGQTPPTTRVVVDLDQACKYELVPGSDNKIVLKLHPGTATAKSAPKAPAQVAVAPSTTPAAKPVVAKSQPVVSSPAEKKSAQTASTASDFVFVEPSYKPKTDAKPEDTKPVVEPAARAQEAAARFADKTASELVTVSAHAAMQPQAAAPAPAAAPAIQPAVNLAAEQKNQIAQMQAGLNGPKYTGEPISVNLKDVDVKDFFRLIHEISGLNVVLDPNVHGTLTIVLDDVPWDQALDIVLKNNDLARELEGNVLRIATVDTLKKEAEGPPRTARSRSTGRRESHGHPLPELRPLQGRGSDD